MTKDTALAQAEAIEVLYARLSGYRDRLAKIPRNPEDQAVFEQVFGADVHAVRPEALVPLVRLFKLADHPFGAVELKYFLPRLCEISLSPLPAVGFPVVAELLGLFDFEQWPNSERTAVWDYFLLYFRGMLEEFAGRRAPPWGAYGYFRELARATPHVTPALLSWEMADFVTSLLHLANFCTTWIEDRPLRERQFWGRNQVETIERWVHTAAREKLEMAARTYAEEPFCIDFSTALGKLS